MVLFTCPVPSVESEAETKEEESCDVDMDGEAPLLLFISGGTSKEEDVSELGGAAEVLQLPPSSS